MSTKDATYFNKHGTNIKFVLDSENDEVPVFCIVREHDNDIVRVAINVSKTNNYPDWQFSNTNFKSFPAAHTAMLSIADHVEKLSEIKNDHS